MNKTSTFRVYEVIADFNPSDPKMSFLTKGKEPVRRLNYIKWYEDPIKAAMDIESYEKPKAYIKEGKIHYFQIAVFFGESWRFAEWNNLKEIGYGYESVAKYLA